MPLPTAAAILAAPAQTLPGLLHATRHGGRRAHTSAGRLATLVASGRISVARTVIPVPADLRLPRRVGAESDDHRMLRALGRALVIACAPAALVGLEVTMAYGELRRRFDGLAITAQGVVAIFAGACDGRDLAELLAERNFAHVIVLPFRGLTPTEAEAFLFSHATAPKLPL